jgi:hypothetical protein
MADRKPLVLKENHSALNRAALNWLKEAKAPAPDHYLHLLNLAHWGLEMQVASGWKERDALKEQVNVLFAWKAASVLLWLLSNPEGGDRSEQTQSLHRLVETASSPEQAAKSVLEAIYSRQVSQNTALQPAASELS